MVREKIEDLTFEDLQARADELRQRINRFRTSLGRFFVEKQEIIDLMTVAAIAQEPTGTLEKIRASGIITIGHRESSIPFSYYDKNEKVVGYGMDLCYLVADAVKTSLGLAKLEIKLVPITPSLRIPSILSGKIDLACETMTNNVERQKVVGFSSTYFVAANRFVSRVAANLRKADKTEEALEMLAMLVQVG